MTNKAPSKTHKPDEIDSVTVEYCGEWHTVAAGEVFTIGREADLAIDDNQFLHRHLLELRFIDNMWWLINVGTRLAVTVSDSAGRLQSWLAPGARLPLVFGQTTAVFTAGPTTYEVQFFLAEPMFSETRPTSSSGSTTIGDVSLTATQHLLILALAEPMLRKDGSGMGDLPTSAAAAQRLGWPITKFNRKLDNVCDKLARLGVQGLRGGVGSYATNRRARLVEYAIAARLVSRADLSLLEEESIQT